MTRNGVLTHHYAYDTNGNRTSQTTPSGSATASYDDRDRLLALGGTVYTYTANGEIATRNEPMIGVTQLRYDSLGRLVGATLPDARVIDYVLDPAGRRIGKKVNGVLVQGFVYGERITPVAELDGAGNVVAVFVYATGRTSPDYIIKGATKYRVLADHVGTPRLVVDTATGTVVAQLEHDVWGNVVADSNPGFQPFGFAGGVLDRDTGLVHMGAREYDPASGRFTSVDPISFGGGDSNLYAYVGGDPVNAVDPSGHSSVGAAISLGGWIVSRVAPAVGGAVVLPIVAGAAAVAGIAAVANSGPSVEDWVAAQIPGYAAGAGAGAAAADAVLEARRRLGRRSPPPVKAEPICDTAEPPPPSGEDDDCHQLRLQAIIICMMERKPLRGGYRNRSHTGKWMEECIRGKIPQRCWGSNNVEY